ncbi:MAG: acyl carrier protein [Furfurilactobacillus sp.]|jgi:acyl carrier protein|uniref:Acyl carrier protein n=1 Tax=Furfurilactobacillus milii TaxID=2888272 RepID=A0ABT6D7M7_9LACO|nr:MULTISPECIES: acyl carrier protein [Furfurilactobacillus]QLE66643.1 Acyl carrier protein [Furfurilactobacillus rossiae]MCF6160094.1 acyl carrier protein [Furfurilactobacillus milii]MCF6162357.1 acyl carrier protein [Furfurilactobacillus milii]MCF6419877.1 acyl carrier protein [Furfurilactobacillus milii]MCH4010651.1 acyl carrier protein [Furfurilactobacillus sp.]
MTKQEIFDKISKIIEDRFEVSKDKITNDLNFRTDLDADSIDFVEFIMELEDIFGAEISDDDAEKLTTIGQVVDYIYDHQEKTD